MFIIDGIVNFLSVAPDSYAPLKHMSAINLIVWLALFLFIFEQLVIGFFQTCFEKSKEYITIPFINNISQTITEAIHIIFTNSGFQFKFAELLKPFSPVLYKIIYIIVIIYAILKATINTVVEHFTGKTLNI